MASGSCDVPEDEAIGSYAASNLPIWMFCNSRDLPELVEFNRRVHARLVAAGLDSRLTTYDADGHDCWTDAYRTPALYEWLWNQSRTANSRREIPAAGR
jgi:enterochelin esterase-like enzyme